MKVLPLFIGLALLGLGPSMNEKTPDLAQATPFHAISSIAHNSQERPIELDGAQPMIEIPNFPFGNTEIIPSSPCNSDSFILVVPMNDTDAIPLLEARLPHGVVAIPLLDPCSSETLPEEDQPLP